MAKPPSFPKPLDEKAGKYTLTEVSQANTCRWPFGDRNFTFCGMERNPNDAHDPYCVQHRRRASPKVA